MTVISSKQLDQQMGLHIDPNSVPRHDGATKGVMQGVIQNPSDAVVIDQGHGQRGSAIYNANEIPQKGFYGSGTIISVNDAPPLEAGLEPKPAPVPGMPGLVAPKPKAPAPVVPVAAPQRPQVQQIRQPTATELLARMGLKPK